MKKLILPISILAIVLLGFFWLRDTQEEKKPTVNKTEENRQVAKPKRNFQELSQENASPSKKSAEKTVPESRIRKSSKERSKKKETPEKAMEKMMGQIITATYGDFFKEMNFPKETEEALQKHLTENQMLLQTLMTQLLDEKISDEEIVKDQEEKRLAQQEKMDDILNASEQASLKDYQKELPVKTAKKMLPAMFNFDWDNMSEAKRTNLARKYLEVTSRGVDPALTRAQNEPFVNERNVKSIRGGIREKQKEALNPSGTIQKQQQVKKEITDYAKSIDVHEKK